MDRSAQKKRTNEPGERIAPCRVDALHEGETLRPIRPQIALTIQGRAVQVGAAKELALGRREIEGCQKRFGGGKTLDIGKMAQGLREAVRVQVNTAREDEDGIDLDGGQMWWKHRYAAISCRSCHASSAPCASGPRTVFSASNDESLVMMRENGAVTMVVSSSSLGASTATPHGPARPLARAHAEKKSAPWARWTCG